MCGNQCIEAHSQIQLLTGPGETRPLHGSVGLLPEWQGLQMPRHPRVTDSVTVRCSLHGFSNPRVVAVIFISGVIFNSSHNI